MKRYAIPNKLSEIILRYIKSRYYPGGHGSAPWTHKDTKFFARGAAMMSKKFTSERPSLSKNYFNYKECRSGYLLYFLMPNFLKAKFCLEELNAHERFYDNDVVKIADIGCGPGTALLASVDYWKGLAPQRPLELTGIDQNTPILHDAKHLIASYACKDVRTIYTKNVARILHNEKFDIIFLVNCLSELGDMTRQVFLARSLLSNNLTERGAIIIIEPALRWTTRNLMKLRDQLVTNPPTINHQLSTINILSPCLHNEACPMLKASHRDWCHMYLDWERPDVIARVDALIGNRKDYLKFAYLILERRTTNDEQRTTNNELWRVVSAPMHSKGKTELLLCNASGLRRVTRLDKDRSPANADLDRVMRGDLVETTVDERTGKAANFKLLSLA